MIRSGSEKVKMGPKRYKKKTVQKEKKKKTQMARFRLKATPLSSKWLHLFYNPVLIAIYCITSKYGQNTETMKSAFS